jgi:hypothetical protein
MMVLKLTTILAAFVGLVGYASSAAVSGSQGPSRDSFDEQLNRAGYVKLAETTDPRGLVVEQFELRTPSKPHYHQIAWVYLTCRGNTVANFAHDETYEDIPD